MPATQTPAITLTKTADPTTVARPGDQVTYRFLITNTGNVTLTHITVNETAFSGTGTLSALSCHQPALAPAGSETCTSTYTVTPVDADAGRISNTATASGTPPGTTPAPTSPPSSATVTIPPTPGIDLVKTASPTSPDLFTVGRVITYTFTVNNTGNVTLADVNVTETKFTGSGTLSPLSCPGGGITIATLAAGAKAACTATLAAGAKAACTATYTLTQADVDAGKVTNTATATGTPPTGPSPTSPPSSAVIPAAPHPGLSLLKTATPAGPVRAGQTITYRFLITNTGNLTLTDVHPTEGTFTGTSALGPISCPGGGTSVATLAPGAHAICTATYVITAADAARGGVTNTATASGTPPPGTPVTPPTSPPSTAHVPVQPIPPAPPAPPTPPTSTGGGLAYTGTSTPVQLILATLLIGTGGLLTLTTRRRRHA